MHPTAGEPEGGLVKSTKVERSLSTSELLTSRSAGITITMTAPNDPDNDTQVTTSSTIRVVLYTGKDEENQTTDDRGKKSCGFHLTRSKWDPYPWVGFVEPGSIAQVAGLKPGDCLLEVCGRDVVGLRVKEVATLIQNRWRESVDLQVWRIHDTMTNVDDLDEPQEIGGDRGVALDGPLPEVARRLASAVSGTVRALECPVCLESAASPVSQCVHGHILCAGCRHRTDRCPVCRVRLGQGRCLLADKVHGTLREAFDLENGEARLGEKLFGKSRHRGVITSNGDSRRVRNSNRSNGTGPKNLLARIFLNVGNSIERLNQRAASAENLTAIASEREKRNEQCARLLSKRLGELTSVDRAKSASTGELANPTSIRSLGATTSEFPRENSNSNSNPDITLEQRPRCNESFLSVPQTPTWGMSTESISNAFLRCPLALTTNCKELVTPGFILEHLGTVHQGPQVHFYGGTATIPLPTPLGLEAIYVFHHVSEMFFFKCDEEAAWMVTTLGSRNWDWYLRGWSADGTEVKLRRTVATLDETACPLLPQHVAPLPKALDITTIEIQLIETRSNELAQM